MATGGPGDTLKSSDFNSAESPRVNTSVSVPYSHNVPKLSLFSGDEPPRKGDTTYDVWHFEVKCIITDTTFTEPLILQAIRKALRGMARQVLIPLGETASSADIVAKLDGLFGNVSSNESVMQRFYAETQKENESVTAFGCRLESLLQIAIENGYVSSLAKNDMLRSKFWTSLRSEQLKSQTRHKYDSTKSF